MQDTTVLTDRLKLCCYRAVAASVAALPAFGKVGAAHAEDQQNQAASSRMSYSRFLEYLDMGRVKKVQNAMSYCTLCIPYFCYDFEANSKNYRHKADLWDSRNADFQKRTCHSHSVQ